MRKLLVTLLFLLLILTSCDKKEYTGERKILIDACDEVTNSLEPKTSEASDELEESYVVTDSKDDVTSVKCFVYFLKLLYSNEKYPVTANPVSFTSNYEKNNQVYQENNQSLLSILDKENNMIQIELYGTSKHYTETSNPFYYLHLDINYDFDKEEVIAFDISLTEVENGNVNDEFFIVQKYYDNTLYSFRPVSSNAKNEMISSINAKWKKFEPKLESAVLVEDDFTYEYTKATNDIFGENYF